MTNLAIWSILIDCGDKCNHQKYTNKQQLLIVTQVTTESSTEANVKSMHPSVVCTSMLKSSNAMYMTSRDIEDMAADHLMQHQSSQSFKEVKKTQKQSKMIIWRGENDITGKNVTALISLADKPRPEFSRYRTL